MSKASWTESAVGHQEINEDDGIIVGVKVIGLQSRNGRKYRPSALKEAKSKYEGARVFIDHLRPDPKTGRVAERSFRDKWGELRNVREAEDGGLRADLHYLKSHAMTPMILESARRFSSTFGLSHDANGEEDTSGGSPEVTKIYKVNSVDVVNDPATNSGLFESINEGSMKKTIKQVLQDSLATAKFAKVLESMIASDEGMGEMDSGLSAEMGETDETPDQQVAMAFQSAMISIISDASLDIPSKLAKLKVIMNAAQTAADAIMGTSSTPAPSETPATESDQTAVTTLQEELQAVRQELARERLTTQIRAMLVESKREPTDLRIKTLINAEEADRKALIESWPAKNASGKPGASPGVLDLDAPVKFSESFEDFKRSVG